MSTKTLTTITEALSDDRQRIQGIEDNDRGGSSLTTSPMYWQLQRIVNFPFYRVANSNTFSSLSLCCLVLLLFSSDFMFFVHCKK